MKVVNWTDDNGYKHRSVLRENDNDPRIGIPTDVPDIRQLNWDWIVRELHNRMMEAELFTLKDVEANQQLSSLILSVVRRQIVMLYKEQQQ